MILRASDPLAVAIHDLCASNASTFRTSCCTLVLCVVIFSAIPTTVSLILVCVSLMVFLICLLGGQGSQKSERFEGPSGSAHHAHEKACERCGELGKEQSWGTS